MNLTFSEVKQKHRQVDGIIHVRAYETKNSLDEEFTETIQCDYELSQAVSAYSLMMIT